MINKVIFEKLREILKETSDNSVSFGCSNPRAITSKDIEIFKMAIDTFKELKKAYIAKVVNRDEDRKYLREVSSLLLQFNSNVDKMLKKDSLRFKIQRDLTIKDPLKIFESFSKAIDNEEFVCRRFELVANNRKEKSPAYLIGDASILDVLKDNSFISEGELKVLINKLKYSKKSYAFYSECEFVNFWTLFTRHFDGPHNIWYEKQDDELGKVIDNFTNLAISNGNDIDDITKIDMAEAIRVRKPDLGPTELELKYIVNNSKEGLIDELVKSFLNHGFKIIKPWFKNDSPTWENLQSLLQEQVNFSLNYTPVLNDSVVRNDIYLEKDGITYALSIDNIEYIGEKETYNEVMVEVELKTKDKDGRSLDTIHDFLTRDVAGLSLIKEGKYQRGMRYTSSKVKDLKLTPDA